MNVSRAFFYVFDDPAWFNKLAITAVITLLSLVFTPVFVGLLGWAALLGYMVELVRNVRTGAKYPLPFWNNLNRHVSTGFNVLAAAVVYGLPTLVLGCVSTVLGQNISSGFIGSSLMLALSCCLFPLLLVYNLVVLPMFALGLGRYVEDPRMNVFFEFSYLFETLRQHLDRVMQWWLAALVANIVFIIMLVIPVLGWAVFAALLVPTYGMLSGQFALLMLGKLKDKPKPPAPAPSRYR